MRSLLADVHFVGHLEDRVSSLSVAQRHLLELAKAFAVSPRLLILDEPTAPLSQDSVELLFTAVRKLAAEGTAVVYITHRLGEVREIADRVTVLRDGKAPRNCRRRGDLGRRAPRHDHRAHARGHVPAEAHAPERRGAGAAGRRVERTRIRRASRSAPARARSWASPAWSETASGLSFVPSPGSTGRPDPSTSTARISHGARCSRAPPTCRPTA